MNEVRTQLEAKGISSSYLRIRAFPFHASVEDFIRKHKRIYVVEQNRDGQMKQLLFAEFGKINPRIESVLHYDGLPIYSDVVVKPIIEMEASNA